MKTGERFGKMEGMSYSKKYRERTIEYRQAGHTLEETHQTFKVARSTIQEWEKQLKETGSVEKKELHRSFRKIDLEKLRAYPHLFGNGVFGIEFRKPALVAHDDIYRAFGAV